MGGQMTRLGLALLLLVTLAHSAAAGVCVTLDEQRDTLSPEDRRAAMITFGQALAKAGAQVTVGDCTTPYSLYNVKLGDSITVYAVGPGGTLQARASKLDELPLVYEQLAHALVTGQPMSTGGGNVDRTNATNDQMVPRRVASDNVKIFRLGYGLITGHGTSTGPAFGFGWRFELDRLAIEISALDLTYSSDAKSSDSGFTGSLIRLGALYYQEPIASQSMYFGGGIGYGFNVISDGTSTFSGAGIEGHATIGYELLRESTIRMFVEATAIMPFYLSSVDDFTGTGTPSGRKWIPSFALQVGLGYGRSNTVGVVAR